MLSVFLSSYRDIHERLGELENAMETLASWLVFPRRFSFFQFFFRVSIKQINHEISIS